VHEDPVPSLHHLPGDLGVAGFIWIPEVPSTKIKKIEDETESDENANLNPLLRIEF
jgi:hypothetical protein